MVAVICRRGDNGNSEHDGGGNGKMLPALMAMSGGCNCDNCDIGNDFLVFLHQPKSKYTSHVHSYMQIVNNPFPILINCC